MNGWQRVSRHLEDTRPFEGLSDEFGIPEGDYNFTSFNRNIELLIVESAESLHTVIRRRSHDKLHKPVIDGRFFEGTAKDSGRTS